MTLIVNFPASQGFVLGADTEETCPSWDQFGNVYDLRKQVQKLSPTVIGNFQFAIAGAGHAGLIDAFIVRANRAIASTPGETALELRGILENLLDEFHRNDVALCQDSDKGFKLFIAYCCVKTQEYGVWVSEQTVLRDVLFDQPEMIGWEHELYTRTALRMFRPNMPLVQAVLAVLYVLKIGDQTSKYIREPFHVAVIRPNGIWMEKANYIEAMTKRLQVFEQQVNNILLACADNSIHGFKLEEMIREFSASAVELHKRHIDEQVGSMTMHDLMNSASAIPRLPPNSIVELNVLHGLQFVHEAERINAETVVFKSRIQQAKDLPGFKEALEKSTKQSSSQTSADQPSPCGEEYPRKDSSSDGD